MDSHNKQALFNLKDVGDVIHHRAFIDKTMAFRYVEFQTQENPKFCKNVFDASSISTICLYKDKRTVSKNRWEMLASTLLLTESSVPCEPHWLTWWQFSHWGDEEVWCHVISLSNDIAWGEGVGKLTIKEDKKDSHRDTSVILVQSTSWEVHLLHDEQDEILTNWIKIYKRSSFTKSFGLLVGLLKSVERAFTKRLVLEMSLPLTKA